MTTTWPGPTPKALAASTSTTSSTTCTSRKWLPEPRLPTCVRPRSSARRLTASTSAPGMTPPSSVRARSSSVASPRRARNAAPSSASRSSSPSLSASAPCGPAPWGTRRISSCISASRRGRTSSRPRLVRTRRTPQLMSKPTPPGETTPSASSIAATPPIGKPVAPVDVRHRDAGVTMPGRVATFATCCSASSCPACSNRLACAYTRPGTRIGGSGAIS